MSAARASLSRPRARPRIDPRMRDRRVNATRARGRTRLRVVLGALVVATLACAGVAVLHTSAFSARHLTVVGAGHTPAVRILSVSGLADHPPLLDVDPGRVAARIETLAWVDSARVALHWPDSVVVVVKERIPAVSVQDGGRFALVDATGRVLGYVAQPSAGTVPVLLGAGGAGTVGGPGSMLGHDAAGAVETAAAIPGALRERVTAVELQAGGAVSLELGGALSASFGAPTDLEAKFDALASVLSGTRISGPARIDLTVPGEPSVESQPA
ncbi:MAG: cell division protein FtsQ/DivIB [Acidimicrobiales bacterium]